MRRTTLLLVLVCCTVVASAGERSFSLTGTPTRPGRMEVRLSLRSAELRAIRVYAQPSNTLLAAFFNEAGPEPVSKSEWLQRTFPTRPSPFPAAWFEFSPRANVTMSTAAPHADDNRVAVYVYGRDEQEDLLTFDVDPREFAIP